MFAALKDSKSKLLVCFLFCQVLFVIFLLYEPSKTPRVSPDASGETTPPRPGFEFLDIATKAGTDKVTTHQYQHAYQKFLDPYRHKPVKMLEIGLGCDMGYGPGKSAALWNEYFTHPDSKIYFMEYDKACLDKWAADTIAKYPRFTLVGGDQADVALLNEFIAKNGRETFDIIIDDGGHSMNQQWTSLRVLWDVLKPGGLYFVEDLLTSFMGRTYGGDPSGKDPEIFTNRIKALSGSFYPQDIPSWLPEQMKNTKANVVGGQYLISNIFSISVYHEITKLEKYNGQKVALFP